MRIEIDIKRKHAYVLSSLFVVLISIGLVNAFGGSNPSVLGHSAQELIVDNNSVVPESMGAAQINSSSLASECATITGSSGLCDGSDGGITSESDPQVSDSSAAGGICFTQSTSTSIECNSAGFLWSPGGQTMTVGSGAGVITMNSGNLVLTAAGSPATISSTGNIRMTPNSGSGTLDVQGSISSTGTISSGGTIMQKCTGCPSFDYYAPTSCVGGCSATDSGFRTD